MRPLNDKQTMKLIKQGYKRFVGYESTWQAHKDKKCTLVCWYCLRNRNELTDRLVKEIEELGGYNGEKQ